MLSVRALVEGVDVPAANVGIIRASSSSVRQRIQTTGRILRRAGGKDGAARLYVIYVRDTTDERIFREVNWSEELGSSAVRSVHWYPPTGRREVTGAWDDQEGALPDRIPEWVDEQLPEFDVGDLQPGDLYPGMYAGVEYHVDASGRPFRNTRRGRQFMTNAEVRSAAELIFRLKRGGKFVVSPENHMITRVNGDLVFLGVLDGKPEFETRSDLAVRTPRWCPSHVRGVVRVVPEEAVSCRTADEIRGSRCSRSRSHYTPARAHGDCVLTQAIPIPMALRKICDHGRAVFSGASLDGPEVRFAVPPYLCRSATPSSRSRGTERFKIQPRGTFILTYDHLALA